jgi:ferredoxin
MFVLSDQQVNSDLITVRFINTLQGQDVVVKAPLGENLLFVGDNAGVKLPRACRTGLCGSCTCEVKDPTIKNTNPNVPEGFATIRACSSRCYVPPGMTEMIVDVGRMKRTSLKTSSSKSKTETDEADDSTYVSIIESHMIHRIIHALLSE